MDSSIFLVVALNGIVEGMLVAIVPEIQSRYGIADCSKYCLMHYVLLLDESPVYLGMENK